MSLAGPVTREWFDRARRSLVLGVSSQFRYWGDEDSLVIDRGRGAYVYDMDGTAYVDYRCGYGPVILGHGDPRVADAVAQAAHDGTMFALTQRREVEAAERFLQLVTWADTMRFTNTGTEATLHAVRIARAHTGRDLIVKFEGSYHGMHDYVLWSTSAATPKHLGSPRAPIPLQGSSGVPGELRSLVRTVAFNDVEALERLLRDEGHRVAALMVEPLLGNCFAIEPTDGYLQALRDLCDRHGVLLLFDEVKTGFRVAPGGAAQRFGVRPDLATYAKALGNGFPVAAIALTAEVAASVVPGQVAQAGTYSGNGVASAAAAATLQVLASDEPWRRLERAGGDLMAGIRKLFADRGVPAHVQGAPALFGIFLAEEAPREHRDLARHDAAMYERLARGLFRRGVFCDLDAREPWFLCAALEEEDVATTLTAMQEALAEATD